MGYGRKLPRLFFGALVFAGVTWCLLVGIFATHATEETSTVTTTYRVSAENSKHWKMIADPGFNYVSKRRVPNGPDPIHNRRAVNLRQPPGRD